MKKRTLMTGIAIAMTAASMTAQPKLTADNIDEIVKAMTLEEKAQLLVGGGNDGFVGSGAMLGHQKKFVPGAAGYTVAIPRLGIPSTVQCDGPAGVHIDAHREGDSKNYFATGFPIGTCLASTWNTDLVEQVGQAIGNETLEYGCDVILGPGLNLHRNPLCGRNFEYYSEDPIVTGLIGTAFVKGVQSQGVGVSAKHYVANSQETDRTRVDERVSPRALRELYLKGFEMVVRRSNPWTIMSAYNKVNGHYAQGSKDLLTKVLREDWGYKGIVETDWIGKRKDLPVETEVAAGKGYSDGEQHYLPVLSNRELVTNTLPVTLTEKGEQSFDLSKLFAGKDGKKAKNAADTKVTIEYTNNPSWLMIQALPSLSNPVNDDNAISLMAAIYSNSIARYLMKSSPVIKQVVELWKQETASGNASGKTDNSGTSLMSSLEKNQELKNIVLNETPWMMAADKESEQKAKLINYFDESQISFRLASQVAKLQALQNPLGAFSWWKGMDGSRYVTTAVAKMMARLNKMIGRQSNINPLFTSSISYLQDEAAREVKEMKKQEAKNRKNVRPSEEALNYLYILALDDKKYTAAQNATVDYLVKNMAERTGELTIAGKAFAAVVLAKKQPAECCLP